MNKVFVDQIGGSISPSLASRLFGSVFGSKPASQTRTDNESAQNNEPKSKPPQQETNLAPPLAIDNIESALPIVPADSFVSRWGGVQWSKAHQSPFPRGDIGQHPSQSSPRGRTSAIRRFQRLTISVAIGGIADMAGLLLVGPGRE